MSTEHHSNGEERRQEHLSASWREVGDQVQGLVTRIANVFRTAWSEERDVSQGESQKFDEELRSSADRMERVFKRVAAETEQERAEAMKSTRKASDQTLAEIRIVAARGLRALNEQLDELAKTLERERAAREKEQMYEPPAGDNPSSSNNHNDPPHDE